MFMIVAMRCHAKVTNLASKGRLRENLQLGRQPSLIANLEVQRTDGNIFLSNLL